MADIVRIPQPLGLFAGQLFDRGLEYLNAFDALTKNNEQSLQFPSYFLLAHSLELLLKSYVAASGATTKIEIRRLGHDVTKILQSRFDNPLKQIKYFENFVAHVNEMNKDYDFRYPTDYRLSMPRPAECLTFMKSLVGAITHEVERARINSNLHWAAETRQYRGKLIQWSD